MAACEVCEGQFGTVPVCTVTFTADDTGSVTPVRMCQECLAAVFGTMTKRWKDAIAAANEAVSWMCSQFGIEPPAAPPPPGDEGPDRFSWNDQDAVRIAESAGIRLHDKPESEES